jgi:hypothetical protein
MEQETRMTMTQKLETRMTMGWLGLRDVFVGGERHVNL